MHECVYASYIETAPDAVKGAGAGGTTFFFLSSAVSTLAATVAGTFLGIALADFFGAGAGTGVAGFLDDFLGESALVALGAFLTTFFDFFLSADFAGFADLTVLAAFLGPLDVAAVTTSAITFFFS